MGPTLLLLATGLLACGDKDTDTGEAGDGGAETDGGTEGDGGGTEGDGGTGDGGGEDEDPTTFAEVAAAALIGEPGDALGSTVLLHDLDGDGELDLLTLGRPDPGDVTVSGCMILPGPLSGAVTPDEADLHVLELGYDQSGSAFCERALAVPDWNGDGYDELLLTAPQASGGFDPSLAYSGALFLHEGPIDGDRSASNAELSLWGPLVEVYLGRYRPVVDQDLDGDGIVDLVLPAAGSPASGLGDGAIYIVRGPAEGAPSLLEEVEAIYGAEEDMQLGTAVAVSDLDGDGVPELLAHAPNDPAGERIYAFAGPVEGGLSEDADWVLEPSDTEAMGPVMQTADWDDDGSLELVLGGTGAWSDGRVEVLEPGGTRLLVVLGALDSPIATDAETVATGDVDEDAQEDLVLGSVYDPMHRLELRRVAGGTTGTVELDAHSPWLVGEELQQSWSIELDPAFTAGSAWLAIGEHQQLDSSGNAWVIDLASLAD